MLSPQNGLRGLKTLASGRSQGGDHRAKETPFLRPLGTAGGPAGGWGGFPEATFRLGRHSQATQLRVPCCFVDKRREQKQGPGTRQGTEAFGVAGLEPPRASPRTNPFGLREQPRSPSLDAVTGKEHTLGRLGSGSGVSCAFSELCFLFGFRASRGLNRTRDLQGSGCPHSE